VHLCCLLVKQGVASISRQSHDTRTQQSVHASPPGGRPTPIAAIVGFSVPKLTNHCLHDVTCMLKARFPKPLFAARLVRSGILLLPGDASAAATCCAA
jgi:hypothetical protein